MASHMYSDVSYGELGPLKPPGDLPSHLRASPRGEPDKSTQASWNRLAKTLETLRDKHAPEGRPDPEPDRPRKPTAAELGIPQAFSGVDPVDFSGEEFPEGIANVTPSDSAIVLGVDAEFGAPSAARLSEYAGWFAEATSMRWCSVLALVSELSQGSHRTPGDLSPTAKLAGTSRLVLDDIGAALRFPRIAGHVTALLAQRLEARRPTLVVCRHHRDEIEEADPQLAALLSRLIRIRMAPANRASAKSDQMA